MGFFPAERRAVRDEREVEAKVEEPRRLLARRPVARRPEMAPQALEKPQSAPEIDRGPSSTDDAFALPLELDEYWSDELALTPALSRERERGRSGADEPFSRLREKVAGDSRPDEGLPHGRPQMAPQAPEKAQSAPGNDMAPDASGEPFLSPPGQDADAHDALAYEPLSTAPIEIALQNAAGEQSPHPCASPSARASQTRTV
jgi:hypothetical protein